MRSQLHFGNQIIVLPLRPSGAIYVRNFNHSHLRPGVVGGQWRCHAPELLAVLGTPPDVCGDCSPVDTLLGSGKRLVELRCLVFLPFRPDGIDILVIEVL